MREAIVAKVKSILEELGIIMTDISDIEFSESITNRFAQVEDSHGLKYLIRFNGKLWAPFSRENENQNLLQLESSGIQSTVIYNDIKNQFQISVLPEENSRLDILKVKNESDVIQRVSKEIRKFHENDYFENNFQLPQVIVNSFLRLAANKQSQLNDYFQFILRIIMTLNQQQDFVPSHNDLLPSSIFVDRRSVTFVDLEYSGNNVRPYDITLLSIKSAFTEQEEAQLIASYDPDRAFNMHDALLKTKPVIYFLLLTWKLASKAIQPAELNAVLTDLFIATQKLLFTQSEKMLHKENQLSVMHSAPAGIYWGTFDPVTLAHLNVAITALAKCNLSKLIIVINDNTSTKKNYHLSGNTRKSLWNHMLNEINIPSHWRNRICIIRQTDEKPYSYQLARDQNPEQRVLAIVGQDSFDGFKKHKSALGFYDHILVVPRGDASSELQHEIDKLAASNVSILEAEHRYLHISSTLARSAIDAGKNDSMKIQLHPSVINHIKSHGLFIRKSTQNTALHHAVAVGAKF